MVNTGDAPLKLKIFFWLIVGAFSTFFAEVFAGSDMFPYFHLWGVGVVFPLYMLHAVVLATIVFRYGKPRFYTLYAAGLLFGLYEAYMTKMLWNPAWDMAAFRLGGVAVVEFTVLVLFWHNILSFITPLFVSESLLTRSRAIANGLPERLRRLFSRKSAFRYMLAGALFFGFFQSINSASPLHSIASGVSTGAVLMTLICLWRNLTSGRKYTMASLLPGKKAFIILFAALLGMYAILGATLRMDALPGISSQATIWIAYLAGGGLLYLALKKSRNATLEGAFRSELRFSWKRISILVLAFAFMSAASKVAAPVTGIIFVLIAWPVISLSGVVLFLLVLRDTLKKQRS